MTPTEVISRVLNSVDGIEISGTHDDVVTTLLAAATAIAGVGLMQLEPEPSEREAVLFGIKPGVQLVK